MKFAPPQGPWKSILSDKKKIKLDQKLKMTILLSLDFERNTRFESSDLTNVTHSIYIYIISLLYMRFLRYSKKIFKIIKYNTFFYYNIYVYRFCEFHMNIIYSVFT